MCEIAISSRLLSGALAPIIVLCLSLVLLSGCGNEAEKAPAQPPVEREGAAASQTAVPTKRDSAHVEVQTLHAPARSPSNSLDAKQGAIETNLLLGYMTDFDIHMHARELMNEIMYAPYDVRQTNNFITDEFLQSFTTTVRDVETLVSFAAYLTVCAIRDLPAVIEVLRYAESQAEDMIQRAEIVNLIVIAYDRMGDYSSAAREARRQFDIAKASKDTPSILEAYEVLTIALSMVKKKDESMRLCDELAATHPLHAAYNRVQALVNSGQRDRAISVCRSLLKEKGLPLDTRRKAESDLKFLLIEKGSRD